MNSTKPIKDRDQPTRIPARIRKKNSKVRTKTAGQTVAISIFQNLIKKQSSILHQYPGFSVNPKRYLSDRSKYLFQATFN